MSVRNTLYGLGLRPLQNFPEVAEVRLREYVCSHNDYLPYHSENGVWSLWRAKKAQAALGFFLSMNYVTSDPACFQAEGRRKY